MITVEPDILDIKGGDITLDAGCGDGRHSWAVCNGDRPSLVAFDLDPVSLKKNKYMLESLKAQKENKGDYHLLIANITKLPFKDGSFDKIICSEVLEHIPEHEVAARELVRNLSAGSCPENITVFRVAISENTRPVIFYTLRILLAYLFTLFVTSTPFILFTGCFAAFSGSRKRILHSAG